MNQPTISSPANNRPAIGGERPLRLLIVVEPGVDGVFRHIEGLMQRFFQQPDIEAHLAYSSVRGSRGLDELVALAHRHGAQTLDLRVDNMPGPGDVRALAQLWRLARAVRPDVIHAHSSKAGVLARSLALLGVRARYFYTPNAYFQMYGASSVKRRLFQVIERVFGRIGFTINVSSSEAEYARRELGLPASRQIVLINGIPCEKFRPAADSSEKNAARARFGLPEDVLLLGTVARYTEQKDPITLYRAVLAVLQKRPALHFAHLGRGELEPQVNALLAAAPPEVQERVHRCEVCEEPAAYYRALDAFVLPSRYEGFALAALEAVATGLPLILADCPGNNDLKDYQLDSVRWMLPEDHVGLEAEILAWADAPAATTNHRQIALRHFDSVVTCEQVIACYRGSGGHSPEQKHAGQDRKQVNC
jgi:glycosyltransferase involved in cell wall biosynthesis